MKNIKKYEDFINEGFMDSVKHKTSDEIRNILKDVNIDGWLNYGCRHNLLWLVKESIEKGADIYKSQPIQLSCEYGHLDIVKFLLENGLDIHHNSESPLRHAITGEQLEVVEYLIDNGSDIHFNNEYPFILAWNIMSLDICQLLLDSGTDIEKLLNRNKNGNNDKIRDFFNQYFPEYIN